MLFIHFVIRKSILECSIILLTLKIVKNKAFVVHVAGLQICKFVQGWIGKSVVKAPCGAVGGVGFWSWGGGGKGVTKTTRTRPRSRCQSANTVISPGPGPGEVADFAKCVASKHTVQYCPHLVIMENSMVYTFPFPVCRVSLRLV